MRNKSVQNQNFGRIILDLNTFKSVQIEAIKEVSILNTISSNKPKNITVKTVCPKVDVSSINLFEQIVDFVKYMEVKKTTRIEKEEDFSKHGLVKKIYFEAFYNLFEVKHSEIDVKVSTVKEGDKYLAKFEVMPNKFEIKHENISDSFLTGALESRIAVDEALENVQATTKVFQDMKKRLDSSASFLDFDFSENKN